MAIEDHDLGPGFDYAGNIAAIEARKTEARHKDEPQSGSSNPEGVLRELAAMRFDRDRYRKRVKVETDRMRGTSLRARQAGATVAQIGRACGMSRQAVYDLWKSGD